MIKEWRQVYSAYLLLKSQSFSRESIQVISVVCQVAMSTEDKRMYILNWFISTVSLANNIQL